MADTHTVTKTKVVQLENGAYGVEFEFDDGYTNFPEVGSKETADSYATVQGSDRDGRQSASIECRKGRDAPPKK
jgi:hypothetical protein